jgi:hypothetical protein
MRLAFLLALAGVAACGAPALDTGLSDYAVMPAYSAEEVQKATAERTIPIVVQGRPSHWTRTALEADVAAGMNGSSALRGVQFQAAPADSPGQRYRVVWKFAPPVESLPPNEICARAHDDYNPERLLIEAYAAFCRGDKALSSVRGRLLAAEGQDAATLAKLVRAMTAALFPADPPSYRRSGDARLIEARSPSRR